MANLQKQLKLLAYVPNLDAATRAYCAGAVTPARPHGGKEGKFPYFQQGYVNLDIPRDSAYTTDIRVASEHFAIADEEGNLIEGAQFDTFAEAERARAGAKISLNVAVDVPDAVAAK